MQILALTPGEPGGIGPDLTVALGQQQRDHALVVYADKNMLAQRAKLLKLPLQIRPWQAGEVATCAPFELSVKHIEVAQTVSAGEMSVANAPYVLACLDAAINDALQHRVAGIVTGPINKAVINQAGINFSGHTEYLAQATNTEQVVMLLATEGLRVALLTTHLPLAQVPGQITAQRIIKICRILHRELQHKYGISKPRILVAGLNPHAGEEGHMGREEVEIINPTLDLLRAEGLDLVGCLPADTLFTPPYLAQADAVLAMYHDQGLPVLKHLGFGSAVNITLGLPIIRTSVDHGTALDIAGSGNADLGSLHYAITQAAMMAAQKNL